MIVELALIISVLASRAERELHLQLFGVDQYNPRVIPDMWVKKTSLDYTNLADFATDKCSAYNSTPPEIAPDGSLELYHIFDIDNRTEQEAFFECETDETIHFKMDKPRGWNLEDNLDFLTVIYDGFMDTFSGQVPKDIELWFDTESKWIRFHFETNKWGVFRGIKLEAKCVGPKNTFATSLKLEGIGTETWYRQVKCLNKYQTVRYEVESASDNTYIEGQSLPLPNSTWIDSNNHNLEFIYFSDNDEDYFEVNIVCNSTERHTKILNEISGVEFNKTLYDQLAAIDTTTNVQELVSNTNRTHLNDLAKLTYPDQVSTLFYLKEKSAINVTQHLSSAKCEQFIVTKIAQLLFNKTRVDFATVSFYRNFPIMNSHSAF